MATRVDPHVRLEISAAVSRFKVNEAALKVTLNMVGGRDIARRAILVESQAKRNASQPHRSGPDTGSAPGKGPAVRTGRLRGSITWRMGADTRGVYADIGSAVEYAPYVEGGTSRMKARPFLRPALQAARINR